MKKITQIHQKRKFVLLGYGFVIKYLMEVLEQNGYICLSTSRDPSKYPELNGKIIYFDLEIPATYKNLPDDHDYIWTFPAQNFERVKSFFHFLKKGKNKKLIMILGSTSAYDKKTGTIDENLPLDLSKERVISENYLLKQGSCLVHLAGLYGKEKHPYNWLNKGLIKNGNKTVNLIHINDICRIVPVLLNLDIQGLRLNLSDGQQYFWKDIWEKGKLEKRVNVPAPPLMDIEERFISNKKIRKFLPPDYVFEIL